MAKKKSLYMTKISTKDAIKYNIKNVLIPKYDKDKDKFNKIKLYNDIEVDLWQYRSLPFHRKLFGIASLCVENGILEKLDINDFVLACIQDKYKDDVYCLIYISKWKFLPKENIILPDGKTHEIVSSISFREMDNIAFTDFYNACLSWWAEILKVKISDLELNCK